MIIAISAKSEIKSGIYCIRNRANGNLYIGSAKNLVKRLRLHKWHLVNNRHANKHLQSAFNKYGESSFEFEIAELVADLNNLLLREQFYLDFLSACFGWENLYNKCPKARNTRGREFSEESRRKMSKTQKSIVDRNRMKALSQMSRITNIGNQYALGHRHTEETRQRLSESRRGRIHSESVKAKIAASKKGKPRSEETKRKLSEYKKAHPYNTKGSKRTPEQILRMVLAKKKLIPPGTKDIPAQYLHLLEKYTSKEESAQLGLFDS